MVAPAIAADQDAKAEKPEKEKKICRKEAAMGSILQTHVCHTAAEWQQIDQANQAQSVEKSRDGSIGGYGNGAPR